MSEQPAKHCSIKRLIPCARIIAVAVALHISCNCADFARAAIITTGVYSGDASSTFEGSNSTSATLAVFGGQGVVKTTNAFNGIIVTTSFSFITLTTPHGGSRFMSGQNPLSWEFTNPVNSFGGWFATNSNVSGATAVFFDASDNVLGTLAVNVPTGSTWVWNGWQSTSGNDIKKVVITGATSGGGFVQYDDMQIARISAAVPEPATLTMFGFGALGFAGAALRRRKRTA